MRLNSSKEKELDWVENVNIETCNYKIFHLLMRNDFTSGRQQKRKALRCISNRTVSQSIDCGIYNHYGNQTLYFLQQ